MKNRFVNALMSTALSLMILVPAWADNASRLKNHPSSISECTGCMNGRILIQMKQGISPDALKSRMNILADETGTAGTYRTKKFNVLNALSSRDLILLDYPGVSTKKLLSAFKDHPCVAMAEPDYIITIDAVPDDAEFNQLWALDNTGQVVDEEPGTYDADMDVPEAWDRLSSADRDVVVAVIDTGVDYTHEDIAANMWTNDLELNGQAGVDDDGNGYVDDIYGIDTCNSDSDPYDDHYHGTHVAGTIAAVTDNAAGISGITWNRAKIMALKFLSSGGSGATSDAITCIEYVVEMNRRAENFIPVMNASWGSTSPSDALKAALETAAAEGIIMSAAAGNDTTDCDGDQKHYPSSQDVANVISVGATDQDDYLAYFSNYGASEVDIAGPGVNILSPVPGGGYDAISTDPFYDSMEDGDSLWDMENSEGEWEITDEKAFHDNMAWSDSPYDDYSYGELGVELNYSLVSLPIDLSAETGKEIMLGFRMYKDLLPDQTACGKKDTLHIEVSGDNGETWTALAAHSGSDPDWKSYAYSIPADLVSDQFRIRFRMQIWPNGSADGIYIDEVGIGEANAMGAFKFANGTSMAAPHVSGALALMASLYPDETMDERISRLYSGGERLDNLKGNLATDRRINLNNSLEPGLHTTPIVREYDLTGDRIIEIRGVFFGSDSGHVMFHDSSAPDTGVDGEIISWTDTAVTVRKPPFSGGYFYLIDADGTRSGRKPMKVSLWTVQTPSNTRRDSGTAVLYEDKIYTFGGYAGGNNALRSWEVYSVDTDTWEYPYGKWMLNNRAHLASAVLDNMIYLIGGYTTRDDGSNLDMVTVFDPAAGKFTAEEPLPMAVAFPGAAAAEGKIYVAGGLDNSDNPLNLILSFDPDQEEGSRWQTEAAVLSMARFAHGTIAVNGKIYVMGGLNTWADEEVYTSTGEIFNPATGSVIPMASMPIPLARFGTATDGRYIYVVGGTNNDFWYTPKDTVLRYDTHTDTWASLPDRQLDQSKLAAPAVFVPGIGIFSPNGGFINTDEPGGMFGLPFEALDENAFLDISDFTDSDGDNIPDDEDNCRMTKNSSQIDSDEDGYGNACDCDLNNDKTVDQADFIQFRNFWGTDEAVADFNGDETVNQADYMIFRSRWGTTAPFE